MGGVNKKKRGHKETGIAEVKLIGMLILVQGAVTTEV